MVKYNETQLDHVFSALSDPTRRAIISRLAEGEATVGELASPFGMSLPAVSKHLRVLESASLITRNITGRHHYCQLNPGALQLAQNWIAHYRRFWEAQLDGLNDYLITNNKEKKHGHRSKTRKRNT